MGHFRIPFREPIFRHFETTPFRGATGDTTGALQKIWPRGNATATATAQPEEKTRKHNEELLHFVGGPAFANRATRKRNRGDHNG
jgi:hypothetical protein